ncbi:MAG: hypothetical protein JWQ97_313 [Phenylobacterium sp.]|nr:hypothetical protein [Phenylobacterium sp.]
MAKKHKHKSLLPKRIAGVKVPKAVRKGRLGELLASQTGRALLAQAVLAAGAIGATKKAGDAVVDKVEDASQPEGLRGFAGDVAERLKARGTDGKDAGAAGAVLAVALGEAARAFVKALNEHQRLAEQGPADWRAEDDAEGSKKKPGSYPSHTH